MIMKLKDSYVIRLVIKFVVINRTAKNHLFNFAITIFNANIDSIITLTLQEIKSLKNH